MRGNGCVIGSVSEFVDLRECDGGRILRAAHVTFGDGCAGILQCESLRSECGREQAAQDAAAPDLVIISSMDWVCAERVVAELSKLALPVAIVVGEDFPSVFEQAMLCEVDDAALQHGIAVRCVTSLDELIEVAPSLVEARPGLVPARLY